MELSDKLKKAYIGGHSNLKFDLSVTPMKIFVDRMEGAKQTFILPWNDIEAVKDCFEKYGDQVAMVHCEIIAYNHFGLMPRPGFLEGLKELCEQYNVVLSFDEVITGFRVGLGGAQAKVVVTPHLATFGKAIAGLE